MNPNYKTDKEKEDAELLITIENQFISKIFEFDTYAFYKTESDRDEGNIQFAFATFDSKNNVVDLTEYLGICSNTEFNHCSFEIRFVKQHGFVLEIYATSHQQYFDENGEPSEIISQTDTLNNYYIVEKDGKIYASTVDEIQFLNLTDDEKVLKIREWFNEINSKQSTYIITKKSINGKDFVGYYEGCWLKKMSVVTKNDVDITTEDFYFRSGNMFFAYKNTSGKSKDESRYYFSNGEMFRFLKGTEKKMIDKSTKFFMDTDAEINLITKEYLNTFKK